MIFLRIKTAHADESPFISVPASATCCSTFFMDLPSFFSQTTTTTTTATTTTTTTTTTTSKTITQKIKIKMKKTLHRQQWASFMSRTSPCVNHSFSPASSGVLPGLHGTIGRCHRHRHHQHYPQNNNNNRRRRHHHDVQFSSGVLPGLHGMIGRFHRRIHHQPSSK